jgi:hypothetical protein
MARLRERVREREIEREVERERDRERKRGSVGIESSTYTFTHMPVFDFISRTTRAGVDEVHFSRGAWGAGQA